jgi:siroheme decarboxylase
MTGLQTAILAQLQKGLPIVPRPFEELGKLTGCSEQEALDTVRALVEDGAIRKFGAFINHYAAGFAANAMVAWDVPEERLEAVGQSFSQYKNISHCYARPRSEKWPYRLYTMIHCRTKQDVENLAKELSEKEGITNFKVLFSAKEYKKVNRWLEGK